MSEPARTSEDPAREESERLPALTKQKALQRIGRSLPLACETTSDFYRNAARRMRVILVERARTPGAGNRETVTLEQSRRLSPNRPPDVLDIDEALNHLAKTDERKAAVVELRYFGGFGLGEMAVALAAPVAELQRDLRLAEAWIRCFLADPAAPAVPSPLIVDGEP